MFAPLAMWDEVDAIVAPLEPLLVPRGLYLDVVVAPNVPATVECDGKAFQAILANLLANAVKYTESGGIVIELEVAQRDNGGDPSCRPVLRLRVRDSGCGIPADRLEAIFAPFEQVDEALNRCYPGTGLGLSIVKGYCERLGGQITVASILERGSTFTVELPFQSPADPTSTRPLVAAIPTGLRALVADERASFRASVRARLGSLGIVVEECACRPTDLVTMLAEVEPYDVLIVENLADWPDADRMAAVAGWRRWAPVLLALEPRYDAEVDQRLQRMGHTLVLWSGATRAHLLVTLARAFREVTPAVEPGGVVSPAPPPLAGKVVLVTEDYVINRMIMVNQLRGNGAQVLEAADGDAAVALAAEPSLDLILMDIQMPGKDGIAAIQEIRRLPAGARLPILGFTASADKSTHQRILAAGADGVLTKPLAEADLVRAIRRALRRTTPSTFQANGD